jgi:hypothetical protein
MKLKPAAPKAAVSPKPTGAQRTDGSPKPKSRPPQFPLGGLLGLMVVIGVAMSPAYYMARGEYGERGSQLAGILMTLAGPLLLMVLASSLLSLYRWWKGR